MNAVHRGSNRFVLSDQRCSYFGQSQLGRLVCVMVSTLVLAHFLHLL